MNSSLNNPPNGTCFGLVTWIGFGLCLAAYSFVALLVGLLMTHAMPVADDFCYAAKAVEHGLFGAVEDEYNTWSGRYSATFVMAWATLNLDIVQQYWLITLTTSLVLGMGIWLFLWAITHRILLSTLLLVPTFVVMIIAMPKPGEILFWLAGGSTYGIGTGLFFCWLAGLIYLHRQPRLFRPITMLIFGTLVPVGLALPGFQESLMMMTIASTGLFALASLWTRKHWSISSSLVILLILCFLAGLVVVQNPGASVRATNHDLAGNLWVTPIVQLLLVVVSLVLAVPAQLGQWASALGVTALWPKSAQSAAPQSEIPTNARALWVVGIGSILVLAAAGLAPAWGIGGPPSPRALTPMYALGFISVIYLLYSARHRLRALFDRLNLTHKTKGRLLAAVLILHAFSIFSSDFVGQGVTNLIIGGDTPAANYRAQWLDRFDAIASAKATGQTELALEPLRYRPSLLEVTDIGPKGGWTSRCFSSYWGMESIHLSR